MRKNQVLLSGGDDNSHHDFSRLLPILADLLQKQGLRVTLSQSADAFLANHVQRFDLIDCYPFGQTLNREQEQGLLEAVRGNPWNENARTRGFIGIHGAASLFLTSKAYFRMLGGKFLVHPPLDSQRIEIMDSDHPVMRGVKDFKIQDGLYLIDAYSEFEALASCEYAGFQRPVVWVKPYGLGKAAYLGFGHGEDQLQSRSVQQILANSVNCILA